MLQSDGQDVPRPTVPPSGLDPGAAAGLPVELLHCLSGVLLTLYAFAARREPAETLCRALAEALAVPRVALCRLSANGDRDRIMGVSPTLDPAGTRQLAGVVRAATEGGRKAATSPGRPVPGPASTPAGTPAHLRRTAHDVGGCAYYLALDASDRYTPALIDAGLDLLQPHLEQAISIRDAMDEFRARILLDVAVLDRAPSAFIVLDIDASVFFANAEGWQILDMQDAIGIANGQLVTTAGVLRAALDAALDALRAADHPEVISCPSLQVQRPSGKPPYVITLLPVIVAGDDTFLLPRRRLLMVITPSVPTRLPGLDYLQRTFGMTLAEARVCRLLATGQELDEVAEHLRVSVTTAKTHLMKIYQKLHINSRTQLLGRLQGHFWTAEAIVVNVDSDGPLLEPRSR